METSQRIIEFGESLRKFIDDALIDSALDYINHSEDLLAFETICDYAGEADVHFTGKMIEEMELILRQLGGSWAEKRYQYLRDLAAT